MNSATGSNSSQLTAALATFRPSLALGAHGDGKAQVNQELSGLQAGDNQHRHQHHHRVNDHRYQLALCGQTNPTISWGSGKLASPVCRTTGRATTNVLPTTRLIAQEEGDKQRSRQRFGSVRSGLGQP